MKKNANNPYSKFRNGVERHVHHVATSASRSNSRYNLNETHATPDGHAVKQIGEHARLIESWNRGPQMPTQSVYREPHFCIELRRQSLRAGFHIIRSTSHG